VEWDGGRREEKCGRCDNSFNWGNKIRPPSYSQNTDIFSLKLHTFSDFQLITKKKKKTKFNFILKQKTLQSLVNVISITITTQKNIVAKTVEGGSKINCFCFPN